MMGYSIVFQIRITGGSVIYHLRCISLLCVSNIQNSISYSETLSYCQLLVGNLLCYRCYL